MSKQNPPLTFFKVRKLSASVAAAAAAAAGGESALGEVRKSASDSTAPSPTRKLRSLRRVATAPETSPVDADDAAAAAEVVGDNVTSEVELPSFSFSTKTKPSRSDSSREEGGRGGGRREEEKKRKVKSRGKVQRGKGEGGKKQRREEREKQTNKIK